MDRRGATAAHLAGSVFSQRPPTLKPSAHSIRRNLCATLVNKFRIPPASSLLGSRHTSHKRQRKFSFSSFI
jgi:hypothetical protein